MTSDVSDISRVDELLQDFAEEAGAEARDLARYASLPVVLTPELVNLLRVNFQPQLRSDADDIVEAELLLSPLCRELGNGLYEMQSEVRKQLLTELLREHGESELHDVASLLLQYTKLFSPWAGRKNLAPAQWFSALNFIDPQRAQNELELARQASGQPLDESWFIAMRQELADKQETVQQALRDIEADSRAALVKALLSAFPSFPQIQGLATFLVGYVPDPAAQLDGTPQVTDALVQWAESNQQTDKLLRLALALQPENAQLQEQATERGMDTTFDQGSFLSEQAKFLRALPSEGDLSTSLLALNLLNEAYRARKTQLGEGHADTIGTLYEVGLLQEELGRLDEAASTYAEAHALAVKYLAPDDPLTMQLTDAVGRLADKTEQFADTITDLNKFTEQARQVLQLSQEQARSLNHNYVGTEHILLALALQDEGVVARVLADLRIEWQKVRSAVEFIIGKGDRTPPTDLKLTPRAKRILELAVDAARRLNNDYIGAEHLLLGLIDEGEGIAVGVLESLRVSPERVRAQVLEVLNYAILNASALGTDLTGEAAAGRLWPFVGRQKEIEHALHVLSRGDSLLLVGKDGIGKTSILYELTSRIGRGDVPDALESRRIVFIDLKAITPGGNDESTVASVLQRALDETKTIPSILSVDDFGTLFAEEMSVLRTIIQRAAAQGRLQLISAAAWDEYNRYMGQFQRLWADASSQIVTVLVEEPSIGEAFEILSGVARFCEEQYRVRITYGALEAAVRWSAVFLSNQPLPRSAIDLIAGAAMRASSQRGSLSPELSELNQELERLGQEKERLVAAEDYEAAADLREREADLRREMGKLEYSYRETADETTYVTVEDIARLVAIRTGLSTDEILNRRDS